MNFTRYLHNCNSLATYQGSSWIVVAADVAPYDPHVAIFYICISVRQGSASITAIKELQVFI